MPQRSNFYLHFLARSKEIWLQNRLRVFILRIMCSKSSDSRGVHDDSIYYFFIFSLKFSINFKISFRNAKKIQVEEHKEHELVYLSSLPMKWSCNNAITKKRKCLSKHTEEEDYRNHGVYACIQCGFYICQSDGRAFLKPEDIEEEKKMLFY